MANIEHSAITDPNVHEPKGISTASINTVYKADGLGSGNWVTIFPPNTVVVNSVSDFPTAVGGVITLAANTIYVLGADISTSNRFVMSDKSFITGVNFQGNTLTYTGTGSMFTGVDVTATVKDIHLDCPNSQVFNFSDVSSPGTHLAIIDNVSVDSCTKWGTFNDLITLEILNSSCPDADDGVTIQGSNWLICHMDKFALISTSSSFTGVDLTSSVIPNLEWSNLILSAPAGGVGISGLTSSGNITANKLAMVIGSDFSGGLTPLNNITEDDVRWSFYNNTGVVDTVRSADTFLTSSRTVTNPGVGVYTAIGGANWTSDITNKFSATNAGLLTSTAEIDHDFMIEATATVAKSGGGSDQLGLRIAVNGTTLAKSTAVTQNANPTSLTSLAMITLSQGDTVQLYVADLTSGTPDIIVSQANLVVKEI